MHPYTSRLSGSQQQRPAITRPFMHPKVIDPRTGPPIKAGGPAQRIVADLYRNTAVHGRAAVDQIFSCLRKHASPAIFGCDL